MRIWAKKRKIYSNKHGYLGGINFNLMLAVCCQMYPNADAGRLLFLFFDIMHKWDWPNPLLLCAPYPLGGPFDSEVWDPNNYRHATTSLMPIITPAYPAFNSARSVSKWSMKVMEEELARAHAIVLKVDLFSSNSSPSLSTLTTNPRPRPHYKPSPSPCS